jgi:hypothetical protein
MFSNVVLGPSRCLWVQEKDGQLLYSGEELSEPLELVVAPEVLANTQTYYVFEVSEETIGKWLVDTGTRNYIHRTKEGGVCHYVGKQV